MKKNKIISEENDIIAQQAMENLNLTPKKANTFAKQARALQKNLALRKKQMQERAEQNNCLAHSADNNTSTNDNN